MAGIPTESRFFRLNTVAAQRRIHTVFPIYFLRLPAASGGLYAQNRCAVPLYLTTDGQA